jgi:hypothetical protein
VNLICQASGRARRPLWLTTCRSRGLTC